jgi:hypothetical protein
MGVLEGRMMGDDRISNLATTSLSCISGVDQYINLSAWQESEISEFTVHHYFKRFCEDGIWRRIHYSIAGRGNRRGEKTTIVYRHR